MILNIIIGLIGLGIVIIVHEAGHFVVAKLSGIKVEAFSVGWGKKLIGIKRGETEYRLSLIPIGGYCKMSGEEQLMKAWQENEERIPKEKGSFFSVSPWKRIGVVVAGPVFNLLFAVFVFFVIWYAGFTIRTFDNKIILASEYQQDSSVVYPADRAGLETGDRIIAIEGKEVRHYQDIQEQVAKSPGEELTMTVQRDGRTEMVRITPRLDKNTGAGKIGVYSWIEPVIGTVQENSAASIAGLRSGDRIVSVNGKPVEHTLHLLEHLESNPETLTVRYMRNGDITETSMVIPYGDNGSPQLGFSFAYKTFQTPDLNLFQALGKGVTETGQTVSMVFKSIGLLFQGINLREAVSGPIRITYYVGEVASQGFSLGLRDGISNLFRFLSVLSVALFIMNLLPIPALDGGQFVLFLIEGTTGRELKPKLVYRYQMVGMTILIGLIIFTTFNDIFFLVQQ